MRTTPGLSTDIEVLENTGCVRFELCYGTADQVRVRHGRGRRVPMLIRVVRPPRSDHRSIKTVVTGGACESYQGLEGRAVLRGPNST
jgi:hypothetical protein